MPDTLSSQFRRGSHIVDQPHPMNLSRVVNLQVKDNNAGIQEPGDWPFGIENTDW